MTTTETTQRPPRMMTPREVARTGILPENAIRAGIKAGWIPHVQCGVKSLINYDKLVKILEEC